MPCSRAGPGGPCTTTNPSASGRSACTVPVGSSWCLKRGGYRSYIAELDEERHHGSITELEGWLDSTEPDYKGLTDLQVSFADSLAEHHVAQWEHELGGGDA